MRPVTVTVSAVEASAVIPLDHYQSPSTVAIGVKITTGPATYTVQHTFDDPFDPNFSAGSATWYPHATLAAQTANADGNYAYPPRAVRLNVTALTAGSVTMTVNPAGII